jgi:tetratricopeptide (TPR) repeat protein
MKASRSLLIVSLAASQAVFLKAWGSDFAASQVPSVVSTPSAVQFIDEAQTDGRDLEPYPGSPVKIPNPLGKLFRNQPKPNIDRSLGLAKQGKTQEALDEIDAFIKKHSKSFRAFYEKGVLLKNSHKVDLAIDSLNEALRLRPRYQPARLLLASIAIERGDLGAAMKHIGTSIGFAMQSEWNPVEQTDAAVTYASQIPEPTELPAPWILQSLHLCLAAMAPMGTSVSEALQNKVKPNPLQTPTATAPVSTGNLQSKTSPLQFSEDVPQKVQNLQFMPQEETLDSSTISDASKPVALSTPQPPIKPILSSASFKPKFELGALVPSPDARASKLSPADEWTKRLKYLAENGTGDLAQGEAFMYSEESGEATLFLPDGRRIRRTIATARDSHEVVAERRPELLKPQDAMYNLALLGKLLPAPAPTQTRAKIPMAESVMTQAAQSAATAQPAFSADNLMGRSDGFWGWLKHVVQF